MAVAERMRKLVTGMGCLQLYSRQIGSIKCFFKFFGNVFGLLTTEFINGLVGVTNHHHLTLTLITTRTM